MTSTLRRGLFVPQDALDHHTSVNVLKMLKLRGKLGNNSWFFQEIAEGGSALFFEINLLLSFDVDLHHCLSASHDALDGHSSTSMWCWWNFEENGEFFMDLSRNCWGRARLNYWNWPFLRFPCCFRSTLTSAAGSLSIRKLWIITQLLMSWKC